MMEWNSPFADQNLCYNFSTDEVMAAIKTLKAGKAPGLDNLYPEFLLHVDEKSVFNDYGYFSPTAYPQRNFQKCGRRLQR